LLSGTSRVVAGGSCPVPTPTPSFVLRLAVDGVADEIAVTSFGWGVSQGGASTTGGARPARLEVGDLNVTKHLDAASPALARHCAEGTRIPSATLRACSDETCAQPYLEFVMQDVLVSAYRPGGAAEGDDCLPVEQVGFNFTKIKADYKEQKQAVELQRSGRKWEVLPPLPDDGT
jgi:type VI secretion system secreted protein Hcp